jgi:uncharacterized protein
MPSARLCPICKRPLAAAKEASLHRPFCSKRCADIDLSRWLNGSYAIPAVEDDREAGEAGEGDEEPPRNRPGPALKH